MCTETINAFATTIIAALVALITWKQWVTDRSRLRHELFDRRYEIYEQISSFLSEVSITGGVVAGRDIDFLRKTKRSYFVYGGDAKIETLISNIYKNAVNLHALQAEEASSSGDDRKKNIEHQRKIKEFFSQTLASMESTFGKYLRLKD